MEQRDIREMKVADIMHTDWPTVSSDATIEETIKLFAESRISGVPVVDNGELVGIVTEGDLIFQDAEIKSPGFLDILGGMIPLGNWEEYRRETMKSAGVAVGEVMSQDPVTVSPDASLSEAATIMAERRIKLLPVAVERDLRGVITRMDILTLHVLSPHR